MALEKCDLASSLFIFIIFALGSNALAVDLDHYFNADSITIKPTQSDYSSDAAFVADSAVYSVPRVCRWRNTYGLEGIPMTPRGSVSEFQLGSNLFKSSSSNWYAVDVTPRFGSTAFTEFLYINADDGSVSCGRTGMEQRGGSWSSGGKWYKTFDLVLKTKPSGIGASKTELVEKIASESETKATKFSNYFTMPKFDGWMLD